RAKALFSRQVQCCPSGARPRSTRSLTGAAATGDLAGLRTQVCEHAQRPDTDADYQPPLLIGLVKEVSQTNTPETYWQRVRPKASQLERKWRERHRRSGISLR